MKILWLMGLSGLSAYCFWIAGRGKNELVFFPAPIILRNKLTKKLGCSVFFLASIWLWLGLRSSFWWAYSLIFGLSFGLVGTYHDYLGKEGTLPSGERYREETLPCWIMTGFGYGIVAIPLYWTGISWQSITLRTVVLMIAIPLIRKIPNVHPQEALSGFVYLASLRLV